MNKKEKILAVPTNIITGFLGAGKTSAILHLLKSKPDNERWAVLVNEFGEIGVDGNLVEGKHKQGTGIFVEEVPGGCMCCASGLPMQIALNQLLTQARPDRLFIEPTGLGHPIEVLQLLSNDYYKDVLNIQKTVTLVDARNLNDSRYTEHATFNQQLAIADIIVANKVDLYTEQDKQSLSAFIETKGFTPEQLHYAQFGTLSIEWLLGNSRKVSSAHHHHHHHHGEDKPDINQMNIPETGFLSAVNSGEGFKSVGWRFSPDRIFNREKLVYLLANLAVERVKGVFITEQGIFGYNATADGLTEIELDECAESRVEIICDEVDSNWESQLLSALQVN
ncbi:CobW family GTP-binding protein [Thalassotalea euphylliae]|uniref:CobW family GTP-binding protein n=1 Tax=Thalassotalea euphylliae TaxID=1655234 RepID=UPI0036293C64